MYLTSMYRDFQQAKPGLIFNSRQCVFKITVTFASKVIFFRFLFAGNGVSREGWTFLEKNDFNALYFPLGWDSWVDSHGQGMRIFYPVRVKTFISWSPKKYDLDRDGVSALLPRAYQENISFNFTKIARQDSE